MAHIGRVSKTSLIDDYRDQSNWKKPLVWGAFAFVVLAGCGAPEDTVIPVDPAKCEDIKSAIGSSSRKTARR